MKNTAKATPPFNNTDVPRASQDTAIGNYQISGARTDNLFFLLLEGPSLRQGPGLSFAVVPTVRKPKSCSASCTHNSSH